MPRNGYGTEVLPAGNPVAVGDTITADLWNNTMSDLAQGVSNSLPIDGQRTPAANLPMGGYRHTGCGDGVAATDYATVGQVPKIAIPRISVYKVDTQTVNTDNSIGGTKITGYSGVEINYNSTWDTTNNKFVAPLSGWYDVRACMHVGFIPHPGANNALIWLEVYKNGARARRGIVISVGTSNDIFDITLGAFVYLTANDYIEIYWHQTTNQNLQIGLSVQAGDQDRQATCYLQIVYDGA